MEPNKKPQNPNAFPTPMETAYIYNEDGQSTGNQDGMTLRDYFAAKAMQSLISKTTERKLSVWSKILIFFGRNGWTVDYELPQSKISNSAYDIADAMLKQREL